jgi:hypothetical protein
MEAVLLSILLLSTLLLIYFLPALVAWARHHPNVVAIFVLNMLLGWTFVFWVIALVWSCMAITVPEPGGKAPHPHFASPPADPPPHREELSDYNVPRGLAYGVLVILLLVGISFLSRFNAQPTATVPVVAGWSAKCPERPCGEADRSATRESLRQHHAGGDDHLAA